MKTKIFLILCLSLLFVSCEKKSMEEQYYEAITYCNLSKVSKLLKKGAKVDAEIYSGKTALNYLSESSRDKSYEIMELLLQNRANVNSFTTYIDSYEDKHYILAKREKNYCISNCNSAAKIDLLLRNGAVVDVDLGNNVTPLMHYIECAHFAKEPYYNELVSMIACLLENDADVKHESDMGVTPLMIALQYRRREIVDLLLEHGAEIHEDYVHLKLNPFRNSVFEDFSHEVDYNFSELTSICIAGYVDLLKEYLKNHKVNLFSHSGDRIDYFMCAVQSNNPEMVEFLLPFYGNINSKRYTLILEGEPTYGYTLYGIARHYKCEKSEKVLLDHGADGFEHY